MSNQSHWENVYTSKASDGVSWYQPHAQLSLQLIRQLNMARDAAVIDVGGGASTLVDDLSAEGFADVTVLDLSAAALATAKNRLGQRGHEVHWLVGDITADVLPSKTFQLWHDRAVFHFLTEPAARAAYKHNLRTHVAAGGFFIIATFAEDGPLKCSNLPVMRYSVAQLAAEFAEDFALLESHKEVHHTPFGTSQNFNYALLQKR